MACYGVFFALTGINQLASHALHGKLVRVNRRGWLFTSTALVGTPIAILSAWWLMPQWLASDRGAFDLLFAFTAAMFALSAITGLLLHEEADNFQQQRARPTDYFRLAWQALHRDANCRRLALLAVLFSTTFMLFPHYQRVVRGTGPLDLTQMTLWVCAQNAATALFSLITGPLSDRYGNRVALHVTMAGAMSAPLLGIALLLGDEAWLNDLSWLVFVPLGFTPVTIRLLLDYALEIAPRHDHPRYVSAVGLCLAVPVFVGAPLMGLLIRMTGYLPAMVVGLVLLTGALVQSFRIAEPRHSPGEP
jgi:predicted MFS family arabinose efflux permease